MPFITPDIPPPLTPKTVKELVAELSPLVASGLGKYLVVVETDNGDRYVVDNAVVDAKGGTVRLHLSQAGKL